VFVTRVPAGGRTDATILHADLDCFFAAVEQRDDPELRGRPVIVGGGVVLAASYEARAFGVHSAMGGGEARRRCPHAVVVPPRFEAYTQASRDVFAVFDDTTPLVEAISIDEAFLDVGGLWRIAGSPREIASRLRAEVRERVGLPISVGVARTKFLAKVASASAKPDGLLVVPPDAEDDFLLPLPVERMWGVGDKTSVKLRARGVATIGDLATFGAAALSAIVGDHAGRHLHALATGRDPRRVRTRPRRRTIGGQRALGWRPKSDEAIDAALVGLVDRVTRRLRDANRVTRTVTIRVRLADSARISRSHTLPRATCDTRLVLDTARHLLRSAAPVIDVRGITLIGIALANLSAADAVQLTLPLDGRHDEQLDHALDEVRLRFGSRALTRAVLVDRDPGIEMPLLPD
jgi:DNA polymerase-4